MNPGIPLAIRPALVAFAAAMRALFGGRVRDIKLFGPWARGDARQDAEVDVIVLVDQLGDNEATLAEREVSAVVMEHRITLVPLVMSVQQFEAQLQQDTPLALEIESEGISV